MTNPKITPRTADELGKQPQAAPPNVEFAPQKETPHIPPPAASAFQYSGPPIYQALMTPRQIDPLKPEKVALVGTQPSSRMLAPYADPGWTIWGSSPGNGHGQIPRIDAWFEMHINFLWPQYKHYGEAYVKWMNEQAFPLVALDNRFWARAHVYPIKRMIDVFGRDFFTSTFAYMMAYAIEAGVKEMALYGIDVSSKGEYATQRPGAKFFIREARKRGIKVIIPQESDLDEPTPLYGYSEASSFGRKQVTRKFEVQERMQQLDQQIAQLNQQKVYLAGAQENIEYSIDIFGSIDEHYGRVEDGGRL